MMRILALADTVDNDFMALTVTTAEYDEECAGILFFEEDGTQWYIPDVAIEDCNQICKELVAREYCDVTRFGEIFREDESSECDNQCETCLCEDCDNRHNCDYCNEDDFEE